MGHENCIDRAVLLHYIQEEVGVVAKDKSHEGKKVIDKLLNVTRKEGYVTALCEISTRILEGQFRRDQNESSTNIRTGRS